jgi:hypothetical protein
MVDLSGVWRGDDGGVYYIQQFDQSVWWLGQSDDGSLQRGISFCNIFVGTLSASDTSAVLSVAGQWADVPRGLFANGFGDLSFSVQTDGAGNPLALNRLAATGGFGGTSWSFQTTDPDRTFPDINSLFNQAVKNTWHIVDWDIFDPDRETLADNLEVVMEPFVLFGTLRSGDADSGWPFTNSFPNSLARTRSNFLALNDPYDTADFNTDSSDADMTCHLIIDPGDVPADFFRPAETTFQQEAQQKIAGGIHPEMVMFARAEDDNAPVLLPGWGQAGGDSVLINGAPINGTCEVTADQAVLTIGAQTPLVGQQVRVTGVMSIDIGHDDQPLEIHPVYAVDVVTATPRDDWSGVYGDVPGPGQGVGGFTYYVHQVFNTFWMLITSPFRDLTFVAVFSGELQPDGATVSGEWSTVPISVSEGAGHIDFTLDPGKHKIIAGSAGFTDLVGLSGRVLRKLYDSNGSACPVIGDVLVAVQGARPCDVLEVQGAAVTYTAVNSALSDLPNVQYQWSATAGNIVGPTNQNTVEIRDLPPAGTAMTVAVDISAETGGACKYHGERTFTTRTQAEANRDRIWCEIRLTVVALVNQYFAAARVAPPGTQPEVPDPAALHDIEKALARLTELVHKLDPQRGK